MNSKRVVQILTIAGFAVAMLGCRLDRENRVFLPPHKWDQVEGLYEETQNIDMVRRNLEDLQWPPAEINEAVYRLQKAYAVVEPEEHPGL
ncbi:hypothetical protein JXA32_00105 [Candidatus Sumerlaeota bacterium]|nr:hypothetical protein [Candidatus Sumerlaeota bacterium]